MHGAALEQGDRRPGRCIMRKYHLSELNLFWGLSPLSPQCSGRLCDNASAETQTGNNSSPIGGPSDLRLPLSLMQTHTLTHSLSHTHIHTNSHSLSFPFTELDGIRENAKKDKHTHISQTLQSVPPATVKEWASVVPLVYRRSTHGKTASWHALYTKYTLAAARESVY